MTSSLYSYTMKHFFRNRVSNLTVINKPFLQTSWGMKQIDTPFQKLLGPVNKTVFKNVWGQSIKPFIKFVSIKPFLKTCANKTYCKNLFL